MRLRDALKLPFLAALYGLTAALALVFESEAARRAWRMILLPVAGFAILLFVVVQIPCEHTARDVVTVPMRAAPPALHSDLPFYEHLTPVRLVGEEFDYAMHPGYQIPIRFDFGEPFDWDEVVSARLSLNARVRSRSDRVEGTEAIWVDGVLSGAPFRGFVDEDRVTFDLSRTNDTFLQRLADCCEQRLAWTEMGIDELLEGSGVSPADLLADGVLEVVIADDTEIMAAELEVCSTGGAWTHCRTAWISPTESYVQSRAQPRLLGERFE